MKNAEEVRADALEKMLKVLWDQGVTEAFVSECCGKLYVGVAPPKTCKACGKEPTARSVNKSLDNG
jgi:rubrerythrin